MPWYSAMGFRSLAAVLAAFFVTHSCELRKQRERGGSLGLKSSQTTSRQDRPMRDKKARQARKISQSRPDGDQRNDGCVTIRFRQNEAFEKPVLDSAISPSSPPHPIPPPRRRLGGRHLYTMPFHAVRCALFVTQGNVVCSSPLGSQQQSTFPM